MPTDEKRYSDLAKQLKNFDYVIIDTCSLMDENFPDWMNVFEKAKKEYIDHVSDEFHAFVPYRCYEELKKHAKVKSKLPEFVEKKIAAKRALRIVKWAKFRKIIEITKKDKKENYADNAITVQVIHDRLTKRILVITQDKGLASDLLYWNHSQSQKGKYVAVYHLVPGGELAPNRGKTYSTREPHKPNKIKPFEKPTKREATPAPYDALSAERRLKSVLANPTYPLDKKKRDVQAHLTALAALPKERREQLPLQLTENILRRFLITGTLPQEKKIPQPVEENSNPAPDNQRPEPQTFEGEVAKLRYGDGNTIREALSQAASYHDVMFRYHSIPYNSQFHGPVDVTDLDLLEMAKALDLEVHGNGIFRVEYKGILAYVAPKNIAFRAWIDFSNVLGEKKPEKQEKSAKPARKPAETPKQEAPVKPDETPAKPKKKKAKPSGNNSPVPETTAKPKQPKAKKPQEQKPAGEPAKQEPVKTPKPPKPKKPKVEQPKPEKKVEETPKPEKKKKQPKPAPAESPAPKAETPAKPQKQPKPKKQAKPAGPNPEKIPAEPKKKSVTKPKKPQSLLEEALKADKNLKANVNNSNYPTESKIVDLKAQIERIKKLKPAEREQLGLSLESLKMMLSVLEASKK